MDLLDEIKNIIIDTNVLYQYVCPAEYIEQYEKADKKINVEKLVSELGILSKSKNLIVTSATIMEVITHYRLNTEKLRMYIDFCLCEQVTYMSESSGKSFHLSLRELANAQKLSNDELLKFADSVLERKINDECIFALYLIEIILLPVLVHIESDLTTEYAALFTRKDWRTSHKELLIKSLTNAYKDFDYKNLKRNIFWGMLTIVFCNTLSLIFEYWNSTNKKIDESIRSVFNDYMCEASNNDNFMSALTKLLNSKTVKGEKLLNKVLFMVGNSLSRGNYSSMQIEHIKNIIHSAYNTKSRFYKNDIIDNKILHFYNDNTFIITFDKNMKKTVKKISQSNFDFIEKFY